MKPVLLGAVLALIVLCPGLASVLLAGLGAACVWAAAQPTVVAFVAGLLAWPHLARRASRILRSTR